MILVQVELDEMGELADLRRNRGELVVVDIEPSKVREPPNLRRELGESLVLELEVLDRPRVLQRGFDLVVDLVARRRRRRNPSRSGFVVDGRRCHGRLGPGRAAKAADNAQQSL